MSVQPPAAPLRPLGIGEILDVSVKVVTRHFKTLAICVLVVTIPLAIVDTLVQASTNADAFDFSFSLDEQAEEQPLDAAMIGGVAASLVLNLVMAALTSAACFRAVGAAYLGAPTTWQESLGFAARRLHSIVLVLILVGIGTVLGLVLCLVGAVWLGVALYFSQAALLFEDKRGFEALQRSFDLVRKRWWPTFAVVAVGSILVSMVQFAFGLVVGIVIFVGEPSTIVTAVLATLVTVGAYSLSAPVAAAITAITYFDLRVRKEGFDLQLLAERIGAGPATREVIAPIGYAAPPAQPGTWPAAPGTWPPAPAAHPGPPPPPPPPPPPDSPGFLPPRPPEP